MKKVIVYWPYLFFALITLIFFYPVWLKGLIPIPADLIAGAYYPWLDYKWGYIVGVPVKNPLLSDAVSIIYPLKSVAVEFFKQGQIPLWNPYMFGGYPLLGSLQIGLLFPTMLAYLFLPMADGWAVQIGVQLLIALVGMYLFLNNLTKNKVASIFGAIGFGFGGFALTWLEWDTHVATMAFLPLLLFFQDKLLSEKKLKWGIGLSLAFASQILAGYIQILTFTFIAQFIWFWMREKRKLVGIKILLFMGLGGMLSAAFLLPSLELLWLSQRRYEVMDSVLAFFHWQNLINLLAPDFFGNPVTGNYFGTDHLDRAVFTGVTMVFAALVGSVKRFSEPAVKYGLIIFFLTLAINIESPVSTFLYQLGIWGGPSVTMTRSLFLINFSLSLMAAYGLSYLSEEKTKIRLFFPVSLLGATAGIFVGLLVTRFYFQKVLITLPQAGLKTIESELVNINISLKNSLPLLAIVLALLIFLVVLQRLSRYRQFLSFGLVLMLLGELFYFGWKFNTFSPPRLLYPETPVMRFLQEHPDGRMVAEQRAVPANMWVPFNLESIGGYDGVYPINMAKLLAVINSGNAQTKPQSKYGTVSNPAAPLLNFTSSKYILALKTDEKASVTPEGKLSWMFKDGPYKPVFEDKSSVVLENLESAPRAYLVNRVIKLNDEEALQKMLDTKNAVTGFAITDDLNFSTIPLTSSASAQYFNLANDHTQVKVATNTKAFLVVTDTYYPGWEAEIDGQPTQIHKTNSAFRGVLVPAGQHTIDFYYRPKSFYYGLIISTLTIVLLIGITLKKKIVK